LKDFDDPSVENLTIIDEIVSDVPVTFAGPGDYRQVYWGGEEGDLVCRILSGCSNARASFELNGTKLQVRYEGDDASLGRLWREIRADQRYGGENPFEAGRAVSYCWYGGDPNNDLLVDYGGDYGSGGGGFCCTAPPDPYYDGCGGYYYGYYGGSSGYENHRQPATLVIGLMIAACAVLCLLCLAARCFMRSTVNVGVASDGAALVQAPAAVDDEDDDDVEEDPALRRGARRHHGEHRSSKKGSTSTQGAARKGSRSSMRSAATTTVLLLAVTLALSSSSPTQVIAQEEERPCMPVVQCLVRGPAPCRYTEEGEKTKKDEVMTWQSSVRTVASPRAQDAIPTLAEDATRVDVTRESVYSFDDVTANSTNLLRFFEDFSFTCSQRTVQVACGRPLQDGVLATCEALGETELAEEARGWLQRGLAEHASVASFGVESLSLSRLGAPLDLLRRVNSAALDEVRHAELCFSLAVKFGADPAAARAGEMDDLGETVRIATSLADLVRETVRAGCIAEADAAERAGETVRELEAAATEEVDPDVLAAWRVIASDEARHAALAWDTVRWAVSVCGEECKRIADEELAAAGRQWPTAPVET
jgi:hypothetical protein